MRQFVRVTPLVGGQMLIPVDQITTIFENGTPGCTLVYSSTGIYTDTDQVDLLQSLTDMQRLLRGEQLHGRPECQLEHLS